MRRLLFGALIILSISLSAQDSVNTDYIVRDRVLIRYNGRAQNVVIPPRLGINRIGERAFAGTIVQSVVIPMGVAYIDERAFMGCSSLKSVSLPNTMIRIGYRAFFNCFLLERINIPRSLHTIEEGAFYNCRSLKVIDLPDTLRSLGSRAFSGCIGLEQISVSRRTQLGQHPFMGVRREAISYKD